MAVTLDVSSNAVLLKSPHFVIDEAAGPIDLSLYSIVTSNGISSWSHSCLSELGVLGAVYISHR